MITHFFKDPIFRKPQLLFLSFRSAIIGTAFALLAVVTKNHLFIISSLSILIAALLEVDLIRDKIRRKIKYLFYLAIFASMTTILGSYIGSLPIPTLICIFVFMWFLGFSIEISLAFSSLLLWINIMFIVSSGFTSNFTEALQNGLYYFIGNLAMIASLLLQSLMHKKHEPTPASIKIKSIFQLVNQKTFIYGLRLAIATSLAFIIANLLHVHQAYWAPMTTILIVKPTTTLSIKRINHRFLGTLLGSIVAIGISYYIHNSYILCTLLFFVFFFAIFVLMKNYGFYVFFLTPLIIILLSLKTNINLLLPTIRLENSLLGIIAALIVTRIWLPFKKKNL